MKSALKRFFSQESAQRCPGCDTPISFESINVQEGVAVCTSCRRLYRLSELSWTSRSREEVLGEPPKGCSVEVDGRGLEDLAQRMVLKASMHSYPGFFGLVGMMLFWNSIVSVFLSLAFAGLWANLIGPLPAGMPIPGGVRQGRPVVNDKPMELGETLFLCLFLVPFVLVGTGFLIATLIALAGRVQVVIDGAESSVSTGVGWFKWTQRFDAEKVEGVRHSGSRFGEAERPQSSIELVGVNPVTFGGMLPENRREWLCAMLQQYFNDSQSSLTKG